MVRMIIPPVSDCFMPTLGAAQIVGYLKAHHIKAKLYDANQEFMQCLISKINVESDFPDYFYKNDSEFHKLMQYTCAFSIKYPSVKITQDDFRIPVDWRDTDVLIDYFEHNDEWISVFEQLSCIRDASGFDNIGLSISYEMQLIPALIIAREIKKHSPLCRVVFGGSFFYNYESAFLNVFCSVNFIDDVVIGSGELFFRAIETNSVEQIEGLKIREFDGKRIIDARAASAPTVYLPDFSDIDNEKYPCESKAFPYMINNRCYYGKCKFCNGDRVTEDIQSKNTEKAFEAISQIASKIGIKNTYIVDAALSPKALSVISKMYIDKDIHWIANARFDKPLLEDGLMEGIAANGCEMLRFGLESGSQQVLNSMNKGTDIETAEKILKAAHFCGIKNHVYLMFGYIGETEDNRLETLRFLNRNKEYIYSYSISFFQPIPCTPVYEELLPLVNNQENPYNEMIEMIYGGEENYKRILNAAERATDILDGYAHTNGEHYSANIFGKESDGKTTPDEIIIASSPVLMNGNSSEISDAAFKNRVCIRQSGCIHPGRADICDFFKNSFITLYADEVFLSLLHMDYSGSMEGLLSGLNESQKTLAVDFLRTVSCFSDCVAVHSESLSKTAGASFHVTDSNEFNLKDNCIQFNPENNQ